MSSALLDNLSGRSRTLRRARRNSELAALTVTSCAADLLRIIQRLATVRRRCVAERAGSLPPPGEEPVTQDTIDQTLRDMVMSTKMLGQIVGRVSDHLEATDDGERARLVTEQLDDVARCVTNLAKLCRMSTAEKRASKLGSDVASNTNVVAAVRQLLEVVPPQLLQELPSQHSPPKPGLTQITEDGGGSMEEVDKGTTRNDGTDQPGDDEPDAESGDDEDGSGSGSGSEGENDEQHHLAEDDMEEEDREKEAIQRIEETIYEKLVVQLDDQDLSESAAAAPSSESVGPGDGDAAPPVGAGSQSSQIVTDETTITDNNEPLDIVEDSIAPAFEASSSQSLGSAARPPRPLFANAGRVDGIPSGLRTGRARSDSLVQKLVKSGKNALRTKSSEERRRRANSVLHGREADAPDREKFLEELLPPAPELSLLPPDPDPTVYVRTLLLNEIYQTEAVFLRDLQLMAVLYRDAAVQRGVFDQAKRTGTLKLGLSFGADFADASGAGSGSAGEGASAADHAESYRAAEKIFGNLTELINLLHSLMSLLESQFAARGSAASVCQCYRSQAPSMSSVFGRYCRLFCVFGARQKKLSRRSPQFRALLDDKARRRVCAGRDLATLQVTPVQRICRIPLLFRGLRDCYQPESEDYKAASQVLELFECIVSEINNILPKNK